MRPVLVSLHSSPAPVSLVPQYTFPDDPVFLVFGLFQLRERQEAQRFGGSVILQFH